MLMGLCQSTCSAVQGDGWSKQSSGKKKISHQRVRFQPNHSLNKDLIDSRKTAPQAMVPASCELSRRWIQFLLFCPNVCVSAQTVTATDNKQDMFI